VKVDGSKVRIALIAVIIGVLLGAYIGYALTPTTTFTISPGVYPGAPDYTIWREGSNYFAKNANGEIKFSGTNASQVLQLVLDELDSGGVVFFRSGVYQFEQTIFLPSSVTLDGEGENSVLKLTSLPTKIGGGWGGYTLLTNKNYETGGDVDITIKNLHFIIDPDLIGIGGYERTVFVGLFMGASNITVQNCVLEYSSFYFEPSYNYLDSMTENFDDEFCETDARNIRFINNNVFNGVEGCWLHLVDGAWLENNWIETTLDSSFGLHWGGRNYHITGNVILRLKGDYWTPNNVAGAAIEVTSAKNSYPTAFWQENHIISGNIIRSVNTGYRGEIAFNGYKFRNIRIIGNYIERVYNSTLTSGSYNSGIHIQGQNIIVKNNNINLSSHGLYGIHVWTNNEINCTNIVISGNTIHGATAAGIYVHNEQSAVYMDDILITTNIITGTSDGGYSVRTYANNGASYLTNVRVENNYLDCDVNILAGTTIVKHNSGFVTENSGTATIFSGTTSVHVSHGLADIPTLVIVTPSADIGDVWVDTLTSTEFTIHCSSAPSSDTTVYWYAEYKP